MAYTPPYMREGGMIPPEIWNGIAGHMVTDVHGDGRTIMASRRGNSVGLTVVRSNEGKKYFRVISVHDDYLICHEYNPTSDTTSSNDIAVAKPYWNRKTPFDGKTRTFANGDTFSFSYSSQRARTVTDTSDSSTQDQIISWDYIADATDGEIIRATRITTGVSDSNGDPVVWEDDNTAARGWKKDPDS